MTETARGGPPAHLPVVVVPPPDPTSERFARLVRRLLGAPVARVSLVPAEELVPPGSPGVPGPWGATRRSPPAHSFCQHVVRTGAPLLVADARVDPLVREDPAVTDSGVTDSGVIAYAGVPLVDAHGQVVGSLCAIDHRPRRWTPEEAAALADLAVGCSAELQLRTLRVQSAAAATRAEASLTDRRLVAETLQQAMLTHLPDVDDLEFRARYVASHAGDQVGGDWYDAFRTAQGAAVAAIGDVTGHDMRAAATMGQLRTLLRAFAYDRGEKPSQTLRRLDRAVAGLDVPGLATVVLARIEQDTAAGEPGVRTLRWSNAGHPPPVLLHADGSTTLLEREADLLVGVDGERPRRDWTTDLAPGDTVLLYTDGLVEHRHLGADIDRGIADLRQVLTDHHHLPLDDLLDAVLAQHADGRDDDVALLGVRSHLAD